MPDLSPAFGPSARAEVLLGVIDREGKIARALEALGPVAGRDVALLDARRSTRRRRELRALGARVTGVTSVAFERLPDASADAVVSFWAAFPGRQPELDEHVRAAERVLRPGGRILALHDYGRDDLSVLLADDEREQNLVAWSHRKGVLLLHGFRVRVLHCWWTFDSLEQGAELLTRLFGRRGEEFARSMRRPRLSYKVALYHRIPGGSARGEDESAGEPGREAAQRDTRGA